MKRHACGMWWPESCGISMENWLGPFTPRSSFVSREDFGHDNFSVPFLTRTHDLIKLSTTHHRRRGSNCLWHHSQVTQVDSQNPLRIDLIDYRPNLSTAKRAEDFRPVAETRFAKVHFGKWWKPRGLTGASVSRYDQVLDQSFGCHGGLWLCAISSSITRIPGTPSCWMSWSERRMWGSSTWRSWPSSSVVEAKKTSNKNIQLEFSGWFSSVWKKKART